MSDSTLEHRVLLQCENRVGRLTINRPKRRNALSHEVIQQLSKGLHQLSNSDEVRVIVLTGEGDQAFCAGGDLSETPSSDGMLSMHYAREDFVNLLLSMARATKPIIGRINGHALGGGFGLALSCDIVIASQHATFGTPEIKVGLFPMMIMAVIQRNLGRKRAMELMLTGERLSAEKALDWGIVNEVVDGSQLDVCVGAMAERISNFSPAVLRLGRQAFYKTEDMAFEQALRSLHSELTINTLTEDAAEGIMAFLGRRSPDWKGR